MAASPVSSQTMDLSLSRGFEHAIVLYRQGKLVEAISACRTILVQEPGFVRALHLLGVLHYRLGRDEDALHCLETALAIEPKNIAVLSGLGLVQMRLGGFAKAVTTFDTIITLDPLRIEALNNRAKALMELKRYQDTVSCCDRVLALQPQSADIHFIKGGALQEMRQPFDALACYDHALVLQPRYTDALYGKINILTGLGQFEEALKAIDKLLALGQSGVVVYNSRGNILKQLERAEEALNAFDAGLAQHPLDITLVNSKITALKEFGRIEAARHFIERCLERTPDAVYLYYNLAELMRLTEDSPHFVGMKRIAENSASLKTNDQMHLHFALGKAYADLKDSQSAMHHWSKGAAIKRSEIKYNEPYVLDGLAQTRRTFTKELLESHKDRGNTSALPIFIVGMPRSGSTLIEQILAAHPAVHGIGEIDILFDTIAELVPFKGHETLSKLSSEEFHRIGAAYIARLKRLAPTGAIRITDKMLGNFRFIGLIRLALPNARFIHTHRDPIDTCLSAFSTLFSHDHLPQTYDLGELGRFYRAYEDLMTHWRAVLPDGAILDVRYEDVVEDVEGQARRILTYCGLEWNPHCLEFHKTERTVRTASVSQVRQPLYKSSVGRSEAYKPFLGPLLDALEDNRL